MNIVLIVNTNNRTTRVAMNNNKPTLGLFNNNKPLQDSCWGTWRTGAALCTSRIIYFRVDCPAVKSTRGGAPVSPVSLPFYLLIDFLPFLFVELHVSYPIELKKLSFRFFSFCCAQLPANNVNNNNNNNDGPHLNNVKIWR